MTTPREHRLELRYADRRGADCMRVLPWLQSHWLTAHHAWGVLDTLRCEAVLTLDGEQIGGVEGMALGGHEDRRRRWNPWLDRASIMAAQRRSQCTAGVPLSPRSGVTR